MERSKNKVVVITGAGSGIGKACVKKFTSSGAIVYAIDLNESALNALSANTPYVKTRVCDVSNAQSVEVLINEIGKTHGTMDILINNAGIIRYGIATETSEDIWDEVMNSNLKSAWLCSKYSIPWMHSGNGGVIINVSSVQAFITQTGVAAYTTSKTAMLGLTRSIAVDYAPKIRCLAVCPGSVDTPMLRNAINASSDPEALFKACEDMHLTGTIGKPEQIAALISFLSSEDAAFMTGQAVRIDGGLGVSIPGSPEDK
ncbi:MAG TPA: SDR family oxidoreductase [Saprospiraceae bacterium]|nr:SDR family oxidoreductase [Saprospiraceae bacterium]